MKLSLVFKRIKIFFEKSLHGNFNNFLTTGFRQIIGFLLGLFTSITVAKNLGAEGNGFYVTFTSAVALSFLISSFGFANYQAYAVARKNRSDRLIVTGLVYSVCIFFPISTLSGFVFWKVGFFEFDALCLFVIASTASIIFQSALGYVQGKGNIKYYNILTLISPVTLIIFAIYIIFNPIKEVIFFGFVVSEVVVAFIATFWCVRSLKKPLFRFTTKRAISFFKESIGYGFKSQIIIIITYLMYRGVIFMLASNFSPSSVGVLGFALSLIEKSWIFSQVASVVLFKDMADKKFSIEKLNKSIYLMFILSFIGIFFLVIVYYFIGTHMGAEYSDVVKYLIILSPGVAAFSGAKICVNYLLLRGIGYTDVFLFIVLLLISYLISFILILNYQIEGAAAAISIGYILYYFAVFNLIKFKNRNIIYN